MCSDPVLCALQPWRDLVHFDLCLNTQITDQGLSALILFIQAQTTLSRLRLDLIRLPNQTFWVICAPVTIASPSLAPWTVSRSP